MAESKLVMGKNGGYSNHWLGWLDAPVAEPLLTTSNHEVEQPIIQLWLVGWCPLVLVGAWFKTASHPAVN